VSYGFLPEAEIEYLQAIGFYEDQRPGLGAHLIKEFERTIQIAVERPLT
jgi:toxin ParE1/3/4